jgi:hypothetical protein
MKSVILIVMVVFISGCYQKRASEITSHDRNKELLTKEAWFVRYITLDSNQTNLDDTISSYLTTKGCMMFNFENTGLLTVYDYRDLLEKKLTWSIDSVGRTINLKKNGLPVNNILIESIDSSCLTLIDNSQKTHLKYHLRHKSSWGFKLPVNTQ